MIFRDAIHSAITSPEWTIAFDFVRLTSFLVPNQPTFSLSQRQREFSLRKISLVIQTVLPTYGCKKVHRPNLEPAVYYLILKLCGKAVGSNSSRRIQLTYNAITRARCFPFLKL